MEKNKDIHKKLLELLTELERVAKKNNLKYNLAYGTAIGAIREEGFIDWDTDVDIIVTIDEYDKFCNTLEKEIENDFYLYSREKDKDYNTLFNRIGFKDIPHTDIHIDIFPVVGLPQNKMAQYIFMVVSYSIHLVNYFKNINLVKNKERLSKKAFITFSILKLPSFFVPRRMLNYSYDKLKILFPIKNASYVYNISGPYRKKEIIPKYWISESEYKQFEQLKLPVPKYWNNYLEHIYGDYMIPKEKNYV